MVNCGTLADVNVNVLGSSNVPVGGAWKQKRGMASAMSCAMLSPLSGLISEKETVRRSTSGAGTFNVGKGGCGGGGGGGGVVDGTMGSITIESGRGSIVKTIPC